MQNFVKFHESEKSSILGKIQRIQIDLKCITAEVENEFSDIDSIRSNWVKINEECGKLHRLLHGVPRDEPEF